MKGRSFRQVIIGQYEPDVIRYSLLANGPEKRDADFSYRELITLNNADLVGAYRNLVNRTLAFLVKSYKGELQSCVVEEALERKIQGVYEKTGGYIENGEFKKALKEIFELVRWRNKYFDENRPWVMIKEDSNKCYETLYHCIYSIINIGNLLEPFLPFSSERLRKIVGVKEISWQPLSVPVGKIGAVDLLFKRLDKSES